MLRIGVIGLGVISKVHIPIIVNNQNSQFISVCDVDHSKVQGVTSQLGCNGYINYKTMIDNEKLDLVHICTPHYLHKEMILYALEKGINILCEKPVVMNLNEASEVEKALKKSSVKLGVVFQNRLNSTSVTMKKYIDNETLGKIKGIRAFLTWYRSTNYYTQSDWRGKYDTEGGGLLINQSIHTLDLMQWLGGNIEWVEGSYNTRVLSDVIEVEDTSEAVLDYSNGARGLFYATNAYVHNRPVEIELLFEEGVLRLFNNVLYLETKDSLEIIDSEYTEEAFKNYYGASHSKLIDQFYKSVINGSEDYVSFNEGIKVLKLIEGIRISNDESKRFFFERSNNKCKVIV